MVAGDPRATVGLVSSRLGVVRRRHTLRLRCQYHAGALSGTESRATETGVRIVVHYFLNRVCPRFTDKGIILHRLFFIAPIDFLENTVYRIHIIH